MSTEIESAISGLRAYVCSLHAELTRHSLVAWTSGNVSARVPGTDMMVIKPSGIRYDELTPDAMVVCDLQGVAIGSALRPSSDARTHAFVYRRMPDVGGIVHTHSPYATAWAARGEAIPCVLTAMADEFGGPIPVGPFAPIGDDEIGRAVVTVLSGHPSPAVLMRNHGVFTIGADARAAVKAAVMCEDVARTVLLARLLGPVQELGADSIRSLHDRYQRSYGQEPMEPGEFPSIAERTVSPIRAKGLT